VEELKTGEAKRRGAELLERFKSKLNPRNLKLMEWAKLTAVEDPDHFIMRMEGSPDAIPPQGRTDAPPDAGARATLIATAKAEHTADPGRAIAKLTDYVDGALKEEGLAALTDKEKESLAV
jgi:hypothetical protein